MNFKVFDTVLDGVAVLTDDLQVLYVNPVLSDICGVSHRRMKGGKTLENFIRLDDPIFAGQVSISSVVEATLYKEICYSTSALAEGWAQYSLQPLHGESYDRPLWVLYLRDVTLEKTLHDKYRAELGQKERVIEELRITQAKLKKYSEDLEDMVEARTADLKDAMTLQAAMLDSLGEGFLIFDVNGICQPYYSRVCPEIFGIKPTGQKIWDVLHLDPVATENYAKWMRAIFSQALPFEDVVPLSPVLQGEFNGRMIRIDYHPLVVRGTQLAGIVLVAADISDEIQVRRELEREKHFAFMVTKIIKYREQFVHFLEECGRLISKLVVGFPESYYGQEEALLREIHTLRGGAATFSVLAIEEDLVKIEDFMEDFGDLRQADIERVAIGRTLLQRLSDNYHSFVKSLEDYFKQPILTEGHVVEVDFIKLMDWYKKLGKVEAARDVRVEIKNQYIFEPISKLFGHYALELERLGRNLIHKKFAPLEIIGGDERVIAEEVRGLAAAMIHALRNAVDHGVESSGERRVAGKNEYAQLQMIFSRFRRGTACWLRIELKDDGRGISPDIIRAHAKQRGFHPNVDSLSDQEVIQCVFMDSFTTSQQVTDISGRGVGMSAIKQAAELRRGRAFVESGVGKGTSCIVEVPISAVEDAIEAA